jgi:hypothetical protein
VFTLYDLLPFTVANPIFTVKIHASNQRRHRLHTVAVVEPQKENGKQKQEQNARDSQI